ncbi:MAG: histidine phosphatase family protein [Candidatus Merdivicinus sp.]
MLTYRLFLIRHGLTQGNLEGRFIGKRTDLSLCSKGVKELHALQEKFEYPDVKKVYAAPMKRCMETAEILYPNRLTVPAEGLEEYDFGVFEGRTAEELAGTEMFVRWYESGMSAAPDKAESITAFAERTAEGFSKVVEDMMRNQITTAALILPSGVMMNLLTVFGYPKRDPMRWTAQEGTGFTALLNTQLWQRDGVFEVYSQIPMLREPSDNDWGEEIEDDEEFFRSLPKNYLSLEVEQKPDNTAVPESMEKKL